MTLSEINVLVGRSDREWSRAVEEMLVPRGIKSMIASSAGEAVDILAGSRIHMALVDIDSQVVNGLSIVRAVRGYEPMLPCIMASAQCERPMLSRALALDVFSVIAKPVDTVILQRQLNRLFIKKYNSYVFSE